jgi:pimeloyl-ACP methyl ester carboxylesterase
MKDLLLLHGAIGAKDQLEPLASELKNDFRTYLISFPGHGGEAFPPEPFSIRLFAEIVLRWMDEQKKSAIDVFGYSMGGYVGMYIARHYPERIGKVFTLATKFRWDEATAQKEVKMLDPATIADKVPAFAKALEARHHPLDWKAVLDRTAEMMLSLGKDNVLKQEDYLLIETPVLVSIGDRDKMVSLDETVEVFRSVKNARLLVLPFTPHPLEQVSLPRLASEVKQFFS